MQYYLYNQQYKRSIIKILKMNQENNRSRSTSRKKKKDKKYKQKQKQKYRQKKNSSQSSSRSDNDKKKKKQKNKSKKNKSRSRERSRQKKFQKDKQRKRSRTKSKQAVKKKIKQSNTHQKNEKMMDQIKDSPKKEVSQAERARKFAMRQVKARLLKFSGLYGDDQSDESDNKITSEQKISNSSVILPQKSQTKLNNLTPPPINPQIMAPPVFLKPSQKKRQSKWGKNSSNQPNIMVSHQQPSKVEPILNNLSEKPCLQIDPPEDALKLSQDKSIQIQQYHPVNHQQIDPLDQYMNQIQGQAVQQIDLPKKGEKGKVITFQDIVVQTYDKRKTQIKDENQQQNQEQFRKKFLEAVSNIDEVKASQDKKGTMMDNQERQSDFSDYQQQPEKQLDFFAKQRKMAERKQLAQVDHSKIQYQQVTFNLYRQADQIKTLDPKLVNKFRKQSGDIKIRGKGILNPVFNWYHCGFSDTILSMIEKNNFQKPFPIQAQSIPMILSGRDVIGIAETGSGKTFAYLLPMLKHVSSQRPCEEGEGPIGIIMTPTRQLANQVYIQAKKFCKQTRIRVIAVYGGLQIQKQLSDLKKGAEIIICTPGRMIDILTLNKGRISNLRRVTFLVIDQADRMFDLGFQPQITRIVDNVRPHRQTVMFSATFPKNVQNLARRILTNPVQILVGSKGQACRNVEQIVQVREQTTKFLRLLQILGNWNQKGSILIFIDKQNQADYLYQQLLKHGYDTLVLHGGMDPTDRQFTIYDFKKGIKTIMIATSICARGLDIKQIILVVNFTCPNHLQDYIHRIGRTGRAGNKGTAITFITPKQQQYSIDLLKALQMSQIHPSEDLVKMSQQYLKKVKKGQARKIRNRNIQGIGFKFDKEQQQKTTQIKDMLKKQLKNEGLGGFQDSDDDDIQTKKKKEEQLRGRGQQQRVVEAIKNPEIKNKLLNQAVKAVTEAINKGSAMTTQKLLQIAVTSMKQSITKHKVITSVDDGVQQVTKLINSFQNKGNGQGIDYFSYDFQINDYPNAARQRACSQHFLSQIQKDNNCTISLRGTYVQPGKKLPIGCRKLYLHIQSQDKSYVSNAYKDIKRVIEQGAFQNMHMSAVGKYTI